jgi:hypothetical protein
MDDNGILILIGIILQIITIIDKSILKRLKKSSCFGVNIELNNDNNNNTNKL